MDHNHFKVILTGRRKKGTDIIKAAEQVAIKTSLAPAQVIKLIEARRETELLAEVEHTHAYSIKRIIEAYGLEVKLQPAKSFHKSPKETEITKTKRKKLFSFKNIRLLKKVKVNPVISNNDDLTINKSYTTIKKDSKSLSIGNLLISAAFLAGIWYSYNSNLFSSSIDAFDENGNPLVMLFTTDQCGKACNDVIRNLRVRKVPFKQLNIDPDSEDDDVKLWKSIGKRSFPLIASGNEILVGNSKAQMATLLGINYSEKYLTAVEKPLYRNHFNKDGTAAITIYGAEWCSPCRELKKQLKNEGMQFIYIDMDKRPDKSTIKNVLEIVGYPSVWIGYKRSNGITLNTVKAVYKTI